MADLGQMSPTAARCNVVNGVPVDAKLSRHLCAIALARVVGGADGPYLLGGQFIPMMCFAPCRSALSNGVLNVLSLRAQKQVRGITAGAVVAGVANYMTLRYGAISNFISNGVRIAGLPLPSGSPIAAIHMGAGNPWPAGIGTAALVNFGPKGSNGVKQISIVAADKAPAHSYNAATPTLTQFVGIEVKGKLDYTVHVGSLLLRLLAVPRLFVAARGFVVSILPHFS